MYLLGNVCSGGKAEPGRVGEKVCQSSANEMNLDTGQGVGLCGLAQELAETPGLAWGELNHALLLERSFLPAWGGVGGGGTLRQWMHESGRTGTSGHCS